MNRLRKAILTSLLLLYVAAADALDVICFLLVAFLVLVFVALCLWSPCGAPTPAPKLPAASYSVPVSESILEH